MCEILLDQIATAFKQVQRPTDITKSVARALDDELKVSEPRRTELRRKDIENDWSDVSDDQIEAFDDTFPFLDSEGYHFYFPAFMSYALLRHKDSDSCANNAVIFACANANGQLDDFSPEQMR